MGFRIISLIAKALDFFTADWMLNYHPNGGTVVLLRSLWVAMIAFFVISAARVLLGDSFLLGSRLTATAAVFAAVYAALYSQFLSQFNYTAGLFNQISLALASDNKLAGDSGNTAMHKWKADFVKDAEAMHLATKPMFAAAVKHFLEDDGVRAAYIDYTVGGAQRLADLEPAIESSLSHQKKNWQ